MNEILKIYGPPGTGKTRTLLNLFQKDLEEGVNPEKIAFLTFTRAARMEALTRSQKTELELPYIKTIHSICYHQLGIGKDQILRPEELDKFGRQIGVRFTGNTHDPWIEEFDRTQDAPTKDDILIQVNHHGRHRKIMLKEALYEVSPDIDYKYALWFTKAYRAWKTANGMLDYTDLLARYIEYGKPLDVDVMFVDEAQDLSSLQWDAVFKLGANASKWILAGDDDQAIFHWAGADSHVFQDLQATETIVLGQSFRVSRAVHEAAMKIVKRIRKRVSKEYSPRDSEGLVANAGHLGDMDFNKDTFILFRNHYRGAEITQVLRNEAIPYIGKQSPLSDIGTRMALLGFWQLIEKGHIECSLMKYFLKNANQEYLMGGLPQLSKEHKTLDASRVFIKPYMLTDWHRVLPKLDNGFIEPLLRRNGFVRTAVPKVEVMSIHQSKGREAHTVLLDPEMSRASWLGMVSNPDDEHRCWYVGITRAKECVYYLMPDGNFSYRF